MRGAGVGDGRGEGDGVAVCASDFSGICDTANPAAPAAGRSLTKLRRLIDVRFDFFMTFFPLLRNHRSVPDSRLTWFSILHLNDLSFAGSIDGDNEKIVVLRFRNDWILRPAGGGDDFRYGVVMARNENGLTRVLRANLRQQVTGVFCVDLIDWQAQMISQRLHRLLRPLVLRRVDRVDSRITEHAN